MQVEGGGGTEQKTESVCVRGEGEEGQSRKPSVCERGGEGRRVRAEIRVCVRGEGEEGQSRRQCV